MLLAQFIYYLGALLSIPLLPVFYLQGINARRRVPRLPEASQNIEGLVAVSGGLPVFRLLVLGESSMAGVGLANHADGFAGQVSAGISRQINRSVSWSVLAKSGYDARAAHQKLVPLIPEQAYDMVVVGLGGNDTFYLNGPLTFGRNMAMLIRKTRMKIPEAPIIIAALPPVGSFPALPPLVRLGLGALVRLHSFALRRFPLRFKGVYVAGGAVQGLDTRFFIDGIHPSAQAYNLWAAQTINFVKSKNLL
jgi:lysophospholipase L1-like esterase